MQIPIRVDYAARAIMDLAAHRGWVLVHTSDIAQRRLIPESFLEQVLVSLRHAGIVRSARGPSGGHELTRPPEAITLGHVVRALGEAPLSIACMQDGHCTVFEGCVLEDVWRDLTASCERVLDAVYIQ